MELLVQVTHDVFIRVWYQVIRTKIPFNYYCNGILQKNTDNAKITFYTDYKKEEFEIGFIVGSESI
jgi:hypothetical protein